MIDWKAIANLQVTKKLARVCLDMVDAPIEFYNHKGIRQEAISSGEQGFCNATASAGSKARSMCRRCVTKALEEARTRGSSVKHPCPMGVFRITLPVVVDNVYAGGVSCGGYRDKALLAETDTVASEELAKELKFYEYSNLLKKAPLLTADKASVFLNLLEIIAEEISTYQGELEDKEKAIEDLSRQLHGRYSFDQIIGRSQPMQDLFDQLEKIVESRSNVLILGETGTGKELVAKAIHYSGPRSERPFVAESCSNMPEHLLENELFGHEKGAFTGAIGQKKGLLEIADTGTVFLDEIGDLSPALQSKILRFLEERTFRRVGGVTFHHADVRILAATNEDLQELVKQKRFRKDLFYRLNVIKLVLPPLRERMEDVPLLVEHFMERACKQNGVPEKSVNPRAMKRLVEYSWPGNVRELQNEIEKICALSMGEDVVTERMLSPEIIQEPRTRKYLEQQEKSLPTAVREFSEEVEREIILRQLRKCKWNKTKAAKQLGISRRNLIRKVEQYNLNQRS